MKKFLCLLLTAMLLFGCASALGEVHRGGAIVMAKSAAPTNGLNPTRTNARGEDPYLMHLVYDTLVGYDAEGNYAPLLAESWEIAEDGLTVTFKLRQDVKFHDGTPFNAEAAKFNFEWFLTEECKHSYAVSDFAAVDSFEVVDEFTLRMNMNAVDAALLSSLTTMDSFMISPAAIQEYGADGLYTQACGTGPFMVKEYVENDHILLERNPNYYILGEDGQPLPYLDSINLRVMVDDSVKITNLLSGDIDVVDYQSTTNSIMMANQTDYLSTVMTNNRESFFMCYNLNDPDLAKLQVRQAIYCAINRQELMDVLFEGYAVVENFHHTSSQWFYNDYSPYDYDVERAKSLLAEAGYPDGITLTLSFIAREPDQTMAQILQEQMKASGITLELEALERLAWVEKIRTNRSGQLGIGKLNIMGLDPTQQHLSTIQYIDPQYIPEILDLRVKSASTFDIEERKAILAQFQKDHLDGAYKIFLGQNPRYVTFNNRLHDIAFRPNGTLDFTKAWVDAK